MKRPIRISLTMLVGFLTVLGLFGQTNAQSSSYMSAKESDPRRLGWMAGFPPPPEKLIMQPESDFFSFRSVLTNETNKTNKTKKTG